MMTMEYRDGVGQVADTRAQGDDHEVLVEFPLETVDSYRTVFLGDTFRDSFRELMPAYVWMHNLREPIGRATDAQVVDRERKLQVRNRFSRFGAVPLAERAWSQLDDGTLTDHSFGFTRTGPLRAWQQRGVQAITKAIMRETSPVTFGSIPGTAVADLREDGADQAPDPDTIADLFGKGLLTREEARQLLASVPVLGGAIRLSSRAMSADMGGDPDPDPDADDQGTPGPDSDDDPVQLAQGIDATIDAAIALLDGVDTDSLPPNVAQAVQLVYAADASSDALLQALGADDPDDRALADPDADPLPVLDLRADYSTTPWSQFSEGDYSPEQWRRACLIDTGDGDPDSKDRYSLPVREPDGTVNRNALSAAAGRLGQVKGASPDKVRAAAKALVALYNKGGMKPPPDLLKAAGGNATSQRDDAAEAELRMLTAGLGM